MPVKKGSTVKRTSLKQKVSKGDVYACDVCGFTVIVDEDCGCALAHEIICCSEPMQIKKATAKVAK